jgi:esterase
MKLFFKKTGEDSGRPVIIMHGLFGLSDNWNTIAKALAEKNFCCYAVDLRNHGRSPHSDDFDYTVMAADIAELMDDQKISRADFIGHSMGGKVAMFFSELYTERVNKMIVADIAPRYYPPHHQSIIAALKSFKPSELSGRKEAEEILRTSIKEESTIQFLLKNLYWNENEKLEWRFGLNELEKNIDKVGEKFSSDHQIDLDILFLKGEHSGYINAEDEIEIRKIYPRAKIEMITNAGHWVHAENPTEFLECTIRFLNP